MRILNNLFVVLPPLSEQNKIANYLATKTAQIDRKIELLNQKADKYRELRQSVINETVTRGLDETAVMKDSGIEWIGQIPAHWQVKRLKDVGKSIIGITYSPENVVDEGEGILVLRASNIQDGQLSLNDNVFVNQQIRSNQIVKQGDILLCSRSGSRDLIGKNICIDEQSEGHTFGAFMTVYRSKHYRFISKFFNSRMFHAQSGLFMTSTINQLTIRILSNLFIVLPPPSEQKIISDYLDEKTAQIDKIISTISQQIARLHELRKTLINEVVTGQIKVI